MKYCCELIIALPRQRVIELFDNSDNLSKWQPGLESFTPISGTPGEVGAKSELVYQMGKRRIEMVETITVRNLPDEFAGTYEAKGVFNTVHNTFIDQGDSTLWRSDNVFELHGIFMKLMGWLMPGAFKKQTVTIMNQFKEFAEQEG